MVDLLYKKEISRYISDKCIEKPDGYMFGKLPGTRYASQFYLANLLYNNEYMKLIEEDFSTLIKEYYPDLKFQITGREWSAIPLITRLSSYVGVNAFMIKRNRKTYGKHNYIEGIPNEYPVLIVDDLCNSTDSFAHCNRVCFSEKLETLPHIFAVLNKYSRKRVGDSMDFDRYLPSHKALYLVERDDLNV